MEERAKTIMEEEAMVKEKIKSLEELMETLKKRVKHIINRFEELLFSV